MFTICSISCAGYGNGLPLEYFRRDEMHMLVAQGDTPYTNEAGTAFGITTTQAVLSHTVADFTLHHEKQYADPQWQDLLSMAAVKYYMPDDHEWGGDNYDHTLTQANAGNSPVGGIGATTQADVDLHWWNGVQAVQAQVALRYDNVANADAEAIAEKPSNAAAGTPASQYPVRYFRQGFDVNGNVVTVNPHVEIFVIDCMSYRSPISATDNASKTMLGANQKAWLKAHLLSSAANFKLIFSGKKTYKQTSSDNTDTWGEYTTERNEILDYIAAQSITGIAWLAGDKHVPQVMEHHISDGDTYDHICICACPIHVGINGWAATPNITWHGNTQVYGRFVVDVNRVNLSVVSANNGEELWRGFIVPTSNQVYYDEQHLSAMNIQELACND